MSSLLPSWTLNTDVLTWFATTAIQVTVLCGLALCLARLARREPVFRHSILSIGLCLALISPISTCCLQRLGFALLNLPTQETSDSATSLVVRTFDSPDISEVASLPTKTNTYLDDAGVIDEPAQEPEPFSVDPPSDQSLASVATVTPPTAMVVSQPAPAVVLPWLRISLASCLLLSLVGSVLGGR